MSNRLQVFDYFFMMRPVLFIPGWATLLAGYFSAQDNLRMSLLPSSNGFIVWWNPHLAFGLLVFSGAMGGCFILNQLRDIQTDVTNNKLFLFGQNFITIRAGYFESLLLLGASVIAALFLNRFFFIFIGCFQLLTGYFYNFPPFTFKDKPVSGLLANMTMGWLAFGLGWSLIRPASVTLWLVSLPILFFNTSLYLLTTVPDMKGDQESGKHTFPVKYGLKFTLNLSLFFFILTIAASLWQKNEFMLVVSLFTSPFMVRIALQQNITAALVAVKAGISGLALVICLKFPTFFLLLAVLFFFTRFYYRKRFNFDYPNFRGR
ncbi:prenyltransferase [candidate division KSB1 bacterium]|nr:prenyltransferase [candidate division KSB1 bacterium]RQV99961.1 MAG: prenyltransferase [candidate division KSB1 bacterium]